MIMECMIKMEVSKKNELKLELSPEDVFPLMGYKGEGGQKRFKVLEFITLNGPATNYSIAGELHLGISTTHRILKDLLGRGMIELCREEKHWSGTTKKFYGPTLFGFSCSLASEVVDTKFKEVLLRWPKLAPEIERLKEDDQVIGAYKTVLEAKIKTLSLMMTGPRLTAEQVSEQPGIAFSMAGMFSPIVGGDEMRNASRILYERALMFKEQILMELGEFLKGVDVSFPGIIRECMKIFPSLFKKRK
ncbi:hypothetical protein ES703_70090 [subsurface metagenome]